MTPPPGHEALTGNPTMAHSSRRSNLIAGMFLVAGVLGFVGMIFVLSDTELGSKRDYVVRFDLSSGAPGIKPGSVVTVGGLKVGRVSNVVLFPPGSETPSGVDVQIRIDAGVRLREGAVALLEQPLLGGLSTIDIPSTVGEQPDAQPIPDGGTIPGRIPPPMFLRQAGFDSDTQLQVRSVIDSAEILVDRLNTLTESASRIIDGIEPNIGPASADARDALADLRSLIADVRARQPAWLESIDRTIVDTEAFAARLGPAMDDATQGIDEARTIASELSSIIESNRANVDRAVSNLADASQRLNEQTLPEAERFLERLDDNAEQIGRTVARLDAFLAEHEPSMRHTLGNVRLASDQLKLAMVEIRAQPWRLLVRPGRRELEQELVYDAARAYADAVADLRAASESLNALITRERGETAQGVGTRQSDERLDRIAAEINQAFLRYQDTERALLDRLIENDGR